jgi:alpha-L-rhamnosidase
MFFRSILFAVTSFALVATAAQQKNESARAPKNLRVEYKTDPIGIDVASPRFSWELDDDRRGAQQSAYQILVSESPTLLAKETGDTWSVKLPVRDTNQIEYAGRELVPWQTYHWMVRTFDLAGQPSPWSSPGSFTMGPMRPSDWQAKWISTEQKSNRPKGGFLGYHSTYSDKADDFHYIQIDLGEGAIFDNIILHPARPDGDASKPGLLFPLRVKAYVDDTPFFNAKFMRAGEYKPTDPDNTGKEPLAIQFTRFKIRYLRVVIEKMQQDGDKGFAFAIGELEIRDGTNNIAPSGLPSASDSLEQDGWSLQGLNDQVLIPGAGPVISAKPVTMMRKPFAVPSTPKRVLLAASALGCFDISINGKRITDERLAPGWTDYAERVPYAMYDVTPFVVAGDNLISAELADGWYAGRLGSPFPMSPLTARGSYGSAPCFIAQLHVEPTTGGATFVNTDASWKWSQAGPIRSSDLIDGESHDWRSEQRGYDTTNFDATGWKPATVLTEGPALFARVAEPIRPKAPITAVSFKEIRPRTVIYDFGQVMSGVVNLNVDLKDFATVQIRHAEALDEQGNLYVGNLRRAQQGDRLTLRPGQKGAIGPQFTLHGFRYVEISGNIPPATLDLVTAFPIASDVREVGSFECSDPMLTQLWRNIEWTRRNNCVGLPTDGAGRDERLGWLGDALQFAHTAMFQADLASTYSQWLVDVRGAQSADGRFSDFAPNPFFKFDRARGTPGFADAGVILPWEMYLHYHDRRLLAASLPSMIKWIDWVRSQNPTLVWKEARGEDSGDWLDTATLDKSSRTKESESVQKDLFATAWFARSCELAAKSAFACSNTSQAERLSKLAVEVRAAFQREFTEPDGRLRGDSQAAYALAIDFGLYNEDPSAEARAVGHLVRKIEEAKGALTTGAAASHRALLALSRHGHHDLALKIATRREMPSWGYAIDQGATTVWERWDGQVAGRGFADPGMNSLDSVAFGSIGEWMVRTIGGIELEDRHQAFGPLILEPILDGPTRTSAEGPRAFEHFKLSPKIEGLSWAKCEHDSIAGRIAVSWKREGDTLTYECTIPPNTTATLALPALDRAKVTEGGKPLGEVSGLQVWSVESGIASIEVPAGKYRFTSTLK